MKRKTDSVVTTHLFYLPEKQAYLMGKTVAPFTKEEVTDKVRQFIVNNKTGACFKYLQDNKEMTMYHALILFLRYDCFIAMGILQPNKSVALLPVDTLAEWLIIDPFIFQTDPSNINKFFASNYFAYASAPPYTRRGILYDIGSGLYAL